MIMKLVVIYLSYIRKHMKHYLLLLITISLGFPDSGYNTIYLMEFDNLKNDFTNFHLQVALPDLIKENYKFREDIKVEYAGDISPYIEKYKEQWWGLKNAINSIGKPH